MRILYIIGGLGVGGAERQLLYLVEGIAQRADVTVVSLSKCDVALLPEFERLAGVHIIEYQKRPGIDPTLMPRLVAMLRRERPAIVHTYLRTANYWGRAAAWLAGVPIRIAAERNIEVERGGLANLLDRMLSSVTDRVVVNADAIRDYLVRSERLDPVKIEVIYNGVLGSVTLLEPEAHSLRQELRLEEFEYVVAFIGRLVPQKNPGLFLEMAQAILRGGLKCGFLLVGDGPLRPSLVNRARALGIQDVVRFTGVRRDVPHILRVVDLLVLTSDWEGLPNVILEALAASVPVVAADTGGVRELLVDGACGYVVPRQNLPILVNRTVEILSNRDLRAQCGKRGQEHVQAHFSVPEMVERTLALYNTLLQSKGLPELQSA